MFTGLAEELGIVEKVVKGKAMHLLVRAERVLEGSQVGDSIAVNGVCLTVVTLGRRRVGFDVVRESQERSTLGRLKPGEGVNLERALTMGDRLGGHIVSGHIDGTGVVKKKITKEDEYRLTVKAEKVVTRYLVPKGSVAIDGISLTIVDVKKDSFSVALIPHTLEETNLRFKEQNSQVNIEVDILSKYVFRFLEQQGQQATKISAEYLKGIGFDE